VLALAALSGVSLQSQHVAGIAEITDIEPSLATLVQRGLVVGTQSRYQLADGVVDRLRRLEDLKPWVNRAITYFIAWAERYRRNPDILLDEAEALFRVQQQAIDTRRWGEVLTLGRLLEATQVVHARWGAWAVSLDRCLAAAKAMGDRSAEAWALHQMGSRAVCLGETGNARALLKRAVHLREVLDDETAVGVSKQNLALVLPPASERPPAPERSLVPERSPVPAPPAETGPQSRIRPANELPAPARPVEIVPATPAVALDFASLPLRDATTHPAIPVAHTNRAGTLGFIVVLFAMAGAFAYWALGPELIRPSGNLARISSFLQVTFRDALARTKTTKPALPPEAESRASAVAEPDAVATSAETEVAIVDSQPAATIRIFSPRPSSITRGGPTNLCYALNGALRARLEPGVGDVAPATILTCQRVAPARTTTYELTAYGANGQAVRQQVVIVVR
jgi:hypothetical protein